VVRLQQAAELEPVDGRAIEVYDTGQLHDVPAAVESVRCMQI